MRGGIALSLDEHSQPNALLNSEDLRGPTCTQSSLIIEGKFDAVPAPKSEYLAGNVCGQDMIKVKGPLEREPAHFRAGFDCGLEPRNNNRLKIRRCAFEGQVVLVARTAAKTHVDTVKAIGLHPAWRVDTDRPGEGAIPLAGNTTNRLRVTPRPDHAIASVRRLTANPIASSELNPG
jgi:hypothetical protein